MAKGIQLAGGYAAGGARDALVDLLAQRFAQQKFEEVKAARLEQDRLAREQMAQTDALARARLTQDQQQFGETLGLNRAKLGEDTRQFEVRTGEDRRQFDTGLKFQEGESTREQRNKDREYEKDVSEGAANRKAQLDVAHIYAKRSGQGGDSRTVQVRFTDPQTGEEVIEYMTAAEARERGKLKAPAGRGQPGLKEKFADLFEAERLATDILARGERTKWAGTGPLEGRIKAGLGKIGVVNSDEERLRNDLANLFSLISHERFGAALTPQEISRATGFLAEATDPSTRIQSKLGSLIDFAKSKRASMGSQGPLGAPTAQSTPNATSGTGAQQFDFDPATGQLVPRTP